MTSSAESPGIQICRLGWQDEPRIFLEIAALHRQRIRFGALGALSTPTLAALYRHLTVLPDTVVLAALEEGRTVGFLSGCRDISSMYRQLLLRRGLPLVLQMLRHGDWRIASKAWSVLTYPFSGASRTSSSPQEPAAAAIEGAELLSTAVSDKHERRGIGRALAGAFEAQAAGAWKRKAIIVATNVEDPDSTAFYLRLGFQKTSRRQLHSLVIQQFVKHLDQPRPAQP